MTPKLFRVASAWICACVALGPVPAAAYDYSLTLETVTPTKLVVKSAGGRYREMATRGNLDITARLKVSLNGTPRVTKWSVTPIIRPIYLNQAVLRNTSQYGFSKTYRLGKRPKRINKTLHMSIPLSRLKSTAEVMCRAKADELRRAGMTTEQIFKRDHTQRFKLEVKLYGETKGFGSKGYFKQTPKRDITVVCQKSPPPRTPPKPPSPPRVPPSENEMVSIRSTLTENTDGDSCFVRIRTVFKSKRPGLEFRYRYRALDGQKSGSFDGKTGAGGQLVVTKFWQIPNGAGSENGAIQIIGIGNNFAGNWTSYAMNC